MSGMKHGRMHRRAFSALAAGSMATAIARPSFAQQGHGVSQATPVAAHDAQLPLARFLAAAPNSFLQHVPTNDSPLWSYTDLAQQLAAFDITAFFEDERNVAVTAGLFLPNTLLPSLSEPEFAEAIGFGIDAVGQVFVADNGDLRLEMLSGDLPLDTLPAAWESAGYTRVSVADGRSAWTLGGLADFEAGNPIQEKMFTYCNNVTITDDGLVVFSSNPSAMPLVHQGLEGSILAVPEVSALMEHLPPTLVGCEAVSGTIHTMDRLNRGLIANPNLNEEAVRLMAEDVAAVVEASDRAVGPMPEWSIMIMGVLAGIVAEDPEAELTAQGEGLCRIHAGTAEAAAQVARVVEHRWQNPTGLPGNVSHDRIALVSSASSDDGVALIDFAPITDPMTFNNLEEKSDMWPFLHGTYTAPEE